jgi:cellulose synthase/poly-beta-1,6-N-acetylglucosamine synthase-like glycosyltransferase
VDDGSTDRTRETLERFAAHPQIIARYKENGGKFTAMNLGVAHATDAEFIGFLDADSFVAPDALREIVAAFDSPDVAAVTASMSIHEPKTLFQRMQYAEYSFGITLRHVFASINGLYVTPGPFSFYRRSVLEELGPFKHAYLTEDMEMAMRVQRAGFRIGNALRARVYTKGPPTLLTLIKQRVRWTTGFLRNLFFDYRDLIGLRHNAVLGLLILPFAVMAILGGIFLFTVNAIHAAQHLARALSIARTVPLSYTLSLRPLDWWYMPITTPLLVGLTLVTSVFVWMAIGKRASRTPGRLVPNFLVYLLLYGIVAPVWLIRSVSHVALGLRTVWR